jgi:plasmid maintenance system antidote protein VapI
MSKKLIDALFTATKSRSHAELARNLHCEHSTISKLNKGLQKVGADFILRCYDHAGFTVEHTRELMK